MSDEYTTQIFAAVVEITKKEIWRVPNSFPRVRNKYAQLEQERILKEMIG